MGGGLEGDDHVVDPPAGLGPSFSRDTVVGALAQHRPRLKGRKEVAAYIRTFQDQGSYLRAVFVDQDCTFLGSSLLATAEWQIEELDPWALLEDAFLRGAAGMILARGRRDGTTELSPTEIAKARQLARLGEGSEIYVLDYLVIGHSAERALFAIRPENAGVDVR